MLNGNRQRKKRKERARHREEIDKPIGVLHPPEDEPDRERKQRGEDKQKIPMANHFAERGLNLQKDVTIRKEDNDDQCGGNARSRPLAGEQAQQPPNERGEQKRNENGPHER